MFSVKNVNLETIIDTLSWYKMWQLSGCNLSRAKPIFLSKQKRVYGSFLSRQTSRKSFTLTTLWSLAKSVKSCHGIIVHQRLTVPRQMVLLKERYTESKKGLLLYCCNQVWTKNGGRIPWNVTICETFKFSCLMGRHPMKGVLENQWGPQLFSHHCLSIIQSLPTTSQDSTSLIKFCLES